MCILLLHYFHCAYTYAGKAKVTHSQIVSLTSVTWKRYHRQKTNHFTLLAPTEGHQSTELEAQYVTRLGKVAYKMLS